MYQGTKIITNTLQMKEYLKKSAWAFIPMILTFQATLFSFPQTNELWKFNFCIYSLFGFLFSATVICIIFLLFNGVTQFSHVSKKLLLLLTMNLLQSSYIFTSIILPDFHTKQREWAFWPFLYWHETRRLYR